MPPSNSDPFDSVLNLEDDLYTSAYALGAADGSRAGRVEGRIFGLEKGFEKFAVEPLYGAPGSLLPISTPTPITPFPKSRVSACRRRRKPRETKD
jgi:hypothetical protein